MSDSPPMDMFQDGRGAFFWIEYNGQKYEVNQSRLTQFVSCKRKYYWQFELSLVADKPQWALSIGKAVHEGLATLNTGPAPDESIENFTNRCVRIAADSFDKEMVAVKFMPGENEFVEENLKMVKSLVREHITHWGMDEQWSVLQPEVQGRVEVGTGTGIFLIFRTDAIVSWRRLVFLLEHKTMAQNRQDNFLKYALDYQITAYVYAVGKLLGIRVAGVILNALIKTKTPQFARDIFDRTDASLEEWEAETIEIVRELQWRKDRVRNGEPWKTVFYKNTQECFKYGPCPYRTLCLTDSPTQRLLFRKRDKDYVDDPRLLERKGNADQHGTSTAEPSNSSEGSRPHSSDEATHPRDHHGSETRPAASDVPRRVEDYTWRDL